MTDIIVQWDDQSINTVSFTDVKLANGNFRVQWVHRSSVGKWFGTVSEIVDENYLVVEWDKGRRNSVSVGDIKLIQLRSSPKQCYWRYDPSKWKRKILLSAQKFNPNIHSSNIIRQNDEDLDVIESNDTDSEPEGAAGSDSTTGDDSEGDSDDIEPPLINLQVAIGQQRAGLA